MRKAIYKITMLNWDKYNAKMKRGHKCTMISNGFLTDAKIMALPPGGRLLYLGLLLCCGDVTSNSIECSHDVCTMLAGGRGHVVSMLLTQMQSLQLLTFEKIDPFLNRIDKNRIEYNNNCSTPKKSANRAPSKIASPDDFKNLLSEFIPEWHRLYEPGYVERESAKAILWLRANPKKATRTMRGWVGFFSNWFEKGWDRSRTKGPSNRPTTGMGFVSV